MSFNEDFVRLFDRAPKVSCHRCHVEMTLRTMVPATKPELYTVTYRCPLCGTDIQRDLKVDP